MAYKTKFVPHHPEKYAGNAGNVICRSLWERKFAKYCDETSSILRWSSEEIVIPYISPLDGRSHRYFVDFFIEVQSTSGLKRFLIEVKPKKQTEAPKPPKRKTPRFLREVATYAVNQAKWSAAREYCRTRGWAFLILDETHLFGKHHG
jgi:hypothetical protein